MCMSHVTHLDVSHSDLIHVTCINIYRSVCLSTSRFDMHIDVYIYWYKSRVSRAFCPLYVDMSIIIYLCHDSFTHTTNLICMLIQVTCIRSCVSQYVCVCVCVCVCVLILVTCIYICMPIESRSRNAYGYIYVGTSPVYQVYISLYMLIQVSLYICAMTHSHMRQIWYLCW